MNWICLKQCTFIVSADLVDTGDATMFTVEFNRSPNALSGIDVEQEMHSNFVENYPQLVDLVETKFTNVHTDAIIDPYYFERKIRIRYQPIVTAKTPEAETYINLTLNT